MTRLLAGRAKAALLALTIAAGVFSAGLTLSGPARAQPLVIEGELIGEAELVAAARREGKVVIYSVLAERIFEQIRPTMEKDLGLKVEFLNLTSSRLFPRVLAEFQNKRLEADYVDLTDLPLVAELTKRGVLTVEQKVPAFAALPKELRDPEGRWYSFRRAILTIGINTEVVKKEDFPKSWKDLLDPKWKGKIGFSQITTGGSSYVAQVFPRINVDPQYWVKLARNAPRIYPSVAPAITDAVRGETAIVLTSSATVMEQRQQGAPLLSIIPEEGVGSFPTTGGVTSSAKRPNAAKLALNWLASRRGGSMISKEGYYPIHPDAPVPVGVGFESPPSSKVWSQSMEDWVGKRNEYIAEWRAAFGIK